MSAIGSDPELLDLVEMELREQLTQFGFPGDDVLVVRGSAKLALENPHDDIHRRCIDDLLAGLDTAIPDPTRDTQKPFFMPIEGVYTIEGRGTVVTGKIETGVVRSGDTIEIVGFDDRVRSAVVTQVEAFNRVLETGQAGENVGCLLRGIARDEVRRGQVLVAPGSVSPESEFEAEVYVLGKDEGGRHTPFVDGYMPQFFFRTTDVPGTTRLMDTEMAMPGDGVKLRVSLGQPIAIADGSRFAMREGSRTIGSGVITRIVN